MAAKRKFKRDYIMLESKDLNYRYKDKVTPKAFAKIEVTDEKSIIAIYAENLKSVRGGYSIVAIRGDYETVDLGIIEVNDQGKGEFSINMGNDDVDVKGIALIDDKSVPLIGFKGTKIDNYLDILFPPEYVYEEVEEYEEVQEYDDVEYVEDGYEYQYVEDDSEDDNYQYNSDQYEDIDYVEIDDEVEDEYEYVEDGYEYVDEYIEEPPVQNVRPQQPQQFQQKPIQKNTVDKKPIKTKTASQSQSTPQSQTKQYSQQSPQNSFNNPPPAFENPNSTGALLMPRQIKKGLKYFREVKPFVSDYIENTRWWKIEINPTTMCGYTMPYLGYINTLNYTMYSDASMQSYKYRHYLYGVQYDEYNRRQYYIYAIPGRKNGQPDKGHTGFTRYQPCDNRNNSLGYWLCFIDCKARKIVK